MVFVLSAIENTPRFLGHMRPYFVIDNAVNSVHGDSEPSGKNSATSWGVVSPDFSDVGFCKFCLVMSFAENTAPLFLAISGIVSLCAKEKMHRVYARRIVTAVEDMKATDRPNHQFV
jgi:hypothetical protein